MRFDELDQRMRVFETAHDHCALPGMHLVARLDGRGFTRLTQERHPFEKPFDERFRDLMAGAAGHLVDCGFKVVYAYSQSDEISLLLHREDQTFGRKLRKLNSTLAGEASAHFSLALGVPATFDCRISQLPRMQDVLDYFRWRMADASRNALNGHCYWMLRRQGQDPGEAHTRLAGLSHAAKHDLLFAEGVNFNDLPTWQKRGFGVYYAEVEKQGLNPLSGQTVIVTRRQLQTDFDLPTGELYDHLLERLYQPAEAR